MYDLAAEVESYHLSLFVFTIEDLFLDKGVVTGKLYEDGQWISKEVPIPLFIDVEPNVFTSLASRKVLSSSRETAPLPSESGS